LVIHKSHALLLFPTKSARLSFYLGTSGRDKLGRIIPQVPYPITTGATNISRISKACVVATELTKLFGCPIVVLVALRVDQG